MVTKPKMPLGAKIVCTMLVIIVALYIYAIAKTVHTSVTTGHTYHQVCAPLHFMRKVDYYNGRTLVVCGSPTTEPVLKEYPHQ